MLEVWHGKLEPEASSGFFESEPVMGEGERMTMCAVTGARSVEAATRAAVME